MARFLQIGVTVGDALEFDVDVLVLKYAQRLFGLDAAVTKRLQGQGVDIRLPKLSAVTLAVTRGAIGAKRVLFVGVKPLREFGYSEIREFALRALVSLVDEGRSARHVGLTIHGPGYGLDEVEAFESELAGVVEAVASGHIPKGLERISFVEQHPGRASRLSAALRKLVPKGLLSLDGQGSISKLETGAQKTLRTAGYASAAKRHVFVAMPFAPEMDDVFHYGIQGAANAAGMLCERADLSTFTGDVIDWVKQRISSATLVVADLSSANPNVYLEVGYAWGCRVPTVLLARDAADLKFDVRGQKCIVYKSIRHLEDALGRELAGLSKQR